MTQADSGSTVGLVVGQSLTVSLGAQFRPPTVSGHALSQQSASGGYPTGQPLTVLYRATAAGSVDITTRPDDPCFYTSPPCARPVMPWTVHVVVAG